MAEGRRGGSRGGAIALAIALAAAPLLLAKPFVERWRLDNPSRFSGLDARLDDAARDAVEAARRPREGASLSRLPDAERAIAALAAISRASPWAPGPWVRRGALLAERGREEEALACFDAARAIDPRNASVRLALGDELFLMRGAEAAWADHRAAVELDVRAAGNAFLAHLGAGADPIELAGRLVPEGVDYSLAYFEKVVDRVSGDDAARLWRWLAGQVEPEDLRRPGVASRYLARVFSKKDRARAIAERQRVLADANGVSDAERLPGLNLESGGLFNHDFSLPWRELGVGDWRNPLLRGGAYRVEVAEEPRFDARSWKPEDPARPGAAPWLAIRLTEFPPDRAIAAPAQTLWLDGPTSCVLTLEAATERLYATRPLFVEARVGSSLGTLYFRSPELEGNRPVREVRLEFHIVDDDPPPQEIRIRREAGDPADPPLTGALYLRFASLETAPLDLDAIELKPVDQDRFIRSIEAKQPDLWIKK